MPMHRELDHDFFKKWSGEMAYVLGFFAADGSMLKNARGAHFIEFTITDRVVLEYIQRVTKSNHRIAIRERGGNAKTAYRLQIGSKEWFTDLSRLGFTRHKSKTLQFPDVPKRCLGDFIRGYFDGDGNIYFKKHFIKARGKKKWVFSSRFTSGSRTYLKELHETLHSFGLEKGFIITKSKQSGYELIFSHRDSLALFHLMYNNDSITDLFLPRKYKLFRKAVRTLYPNLRL